MALNSWTPKYSQPSILHDRMRLSSGILRYERKYQRRVSQVAKQFIARNRCFIQKPFLLRFN